MTRIDFHSNVADKIRYTCRLVRKARNQAKAQPLVILLENREQLNQLDNELWVFSDIDFIPHVSADHPLAAKTPVLLTDSEQIKLPNYPILINLSRNTPAQFARYERVFEIISQDPQDAQAGRVRYGFYKQHGHTLNHIVAEAS